MGPLIAIGGVRIASEVVGQLEKAIEDLCTDLGFPPREEFKWSPGRGLWMHDNLRGDQRENFFAEVLSLCANFDAQAVVVIEDTSRQPATNSAVGPEQDVTQMFLERISNQLYVSQTHGIVIVDRPRGGRSDENKFLARCLETLQQGIGYVRPDRIALNVLSTPSKLVRLIQVADLITSCTLATVAGESTYAPRIFPQIKPILHSHDGRIGGVGLKIHPDYCYANLYYWLLGDAYLNRGNTGFPLPMNNYPYASSPDKW